MNNDPYAVALNNALNEIKKICPDVSRSFIFSKDGKIVAGDSDTDKKTIEKTMQSFQNIAEKADTIGSLEAFYVNGKKGKVILSSVNNMHLVLAASTNVDTTYIHSVTRVIIPTVLKLLETMHARAETITPTPLDTTPLKTTPPNTTPLQVAPSKQLVVDTLSGFFSGDSVQIDTKTLEEWSKLLNQKSINYVEIEAFGGKATQCKVKEISEKKLKEKGMIRIPEKVCKTLEVKKGEIVKVQPASI